MNGLNNQGLPALAVFSELAPGKVPEEIQVVPLGRFIYSNPKFTGGKAVEWTITPEDVSSMISTKDQTDVVVDYEHQTLGDGVAPAAGWITQLIDSGARGLVARVNWTAKAAQLIREGAYRYISPVILRGVPSKTETGKTLRAYLHSVAITNRPFLPAIEPLVAKSFPMGICAANQFAAFVGVETLTNEEKAICDMLGVSPENFVAAKAAMEAEQIVTPAQQEANAAAILRIREQFGLTPEDIAKYGA